MADRLGVAADGELMRPRCTAAALVMLAACAPRLPHTAPLPDSATLASTLAPAAAVLDSAINAGAAPGAVLAVSIKGQRFLYGTGHLGVHDPARPDGQTLYDMASLTKVIALTTLAMMAVEEKKLDLDAPVVQYLPDFARGTGQKSAVTVRDLLLHDSGLPADRYLWHETFVRPRRRAAHASPPISTPSPARGWSIPTSARSR